MIPTLRITESFRCDWAADRLVPTSLGAGDHDDSPVLSQVSNLNLWYGKNTLASGEHGKRIGTFGLLVAPDRRAPIYYVLQADRIEARRCGGIMEKVGEQRIALPPVLATLLRSQAEQAAWRKEVEPLGDVAAPALAVSSDGNLVIQFYVPPLRQAFAIRMPSFVAVDQPVQGVALGRRCGSQCDLGRAVIGRPFAIDLPKDAEIDLISGPPGLVLKDHALGWTPGREDLGIQEVRLSVARGGSTSLLSCFVEAVPDRFQASASAAGQRLEEVGVLRTGGEVRSLVRGDDGKSIIANAGTSCLVIADDGLKVTARLPLTRSYTKILRHSGRFLALSERTLDILTETGEIARTVLLPTVGLDAAPCPDGRTCLVALMGIGGDGDVVYPRVVAIDETAGTLRPLAGVYGGLLALDASGTRLFAWIHTDYYATLGTWISTMGDESLTLTAERSADFLVRYERAGESFKAKAIDFQPGHGGVRLLAAPDGAEVAFLAQYPVAPKSALLAAKVYGLRDLRQAVFAYGMADHPAIDMDFQPGGDLVAASNGSVAAFFKRHAMTPLEGRGPLGAITVARCGRVLFTPDGSGLLVCYREPDSAWVLRTVPIAARVAPDARK